MLINTNQHIKKTLITGLLWLTVSFIHGQSINLATALKLLWQKAFTEYDTQSF